MLCFWLLALAVATIAVATVAFPTVVVGCVLFIAASATSRIVAAISNSAVVSGLHVFGSLAVHMSAARVYMYSACRQMLLFIIAALASLALLVAFDRFGGVCVFELCMVVVCLFLGMASCCRGRTVASLAVSVAMLVLLLPVACIQSGLGHTQPPTSQPPTTHHPHPHPNPLLHPHSHPWGMC